MKHLLNLIIPIFLFISNHTSAQHDADSLKASNSYKNATILIRNGLYSTAIDSLKYSAIIREKIYSRHSEEYGIVQNALGISYKNLGNLEKSLEHLVLAEQAFSNSIEDNHLQLARVYNNLANVYKSKLDYGTALDIYNRAIEINRKLVGEMNSDISDYYYNIAEIKFIQKKYDEALDIINLYNTSAYADTRLYYLSLKAAIYQELKIFDKAYDSYQVAIEYAKKHYADSEINLTFELLNYAGFLINNLKITEALEVLEQTKNIFTEKQVSEGIPYSLYLKTKGYLNENLSVETKDIETFRSQKKSNLLKAITYYNRSLTSLGIDINDKQISLITIEKIHSLNQSLDLLKRIADTYLSIYDIYNNSGEEESSKSIQNALNYYQITSNLIQQARKEIYSDENKIQLSELEEETFHKIIQTAWKANNMMPGGNDAADFAFITAERMKASSVFDRLTNQLAMGNSLIPDSLTERERTLNYNITMLNEKLFNLQREENRDEKEVSKADSALFQFKKQREELNTYLENNFSEYYEMKYSTSMAGIDDIQHKLSGNEVLIEYVIDESSEVPELYAFLITPGNKGFYKLASDSGFIGHLEETHQFISNPAYLYTRNDNSKAYCVSAHHLYKVLLQPFEKEIKDKNLIIIPDGKLNYLPFEALLTELPDTSGMVQFNNLPYLIRENIINYSYSANLLFNVDKGRKKSKNRLLAFAPEYNSDTVTFKNEKLVLVPLPGVQREVELIANEIKSTVYKGSEATESSFRGESGNYDILHLAMHAFINDSLPAFSRFAFSQNTNQDTYNDGWLNTADIYNLNLNARLTVLSACNTGSGNLRKGEGVISLARGFLYAGCPSIVMSLWEVEDNAGTEIMHSFYRLLKKGRNVDEALRQAKLYYLEEANPRLAHPHYWLGYVSIGDSAPLFTSYDYYFFGLIILALAGLAADQVVQYRKSVKKSYKRK